MSIWHGVAGLIICLLLLFYAQYNDAAAARKRPVKVGNPEFVRLVDKADCYLWKQCL